MRKVTGYIGALIVVVALMGSVLAGYALNINGQSVVVNEYENVTDVSGLYSHTDEKTYIDYNPASNYIGYNLDAPYHNNLPGQYKFKLFNAANILIRISDNHMIVNGLDQGTPAGLNYYFLCNYFDVAEISDSYSRIWGMTVTTDVNITIGGGTTTLTFNGNTHTFTTSFNMVMWNGADADYWINTAYMSGKTEQYGVFMNNINQIMTVGFDNYGQIISHGNTVTYNSDSNTTSRTVQLLDGGVLYKPGVYYQNINYNTTIDGNTYRAYCTFYPVSVFETNPGMGIDYIESNRVNNYPVAPTQSQYDVTTFKQVNLQAQSVANYATPGRDWFLGDDGYEPRTGPSWIPLKFYAPNYNGSTRVDNIKVNNLATLINAVEKPAGAKLIRIDMGAPDAVQTIAYPVPTGEFTMYRQIASNFVAIGPYAYTYPYTLGGQNGAYYNHSVYYVCDLQTGMTQMFNIEGTLVGTYQTSALYVQYITSATNGGLVEYVDGQTPTIHNSYYTCQSARIAPYLNFTITSSNTVVTPHYMDITKGMAIKSDNTTNTVWNNEYENGVIDILFRAEDTGWTYHNDLTISGNDIAVDYNLGRFSVTLNDNDPVDIGTWRNIILHIDLINGELSVRPVRTFNSYSNVVMDNASIEIGELVNAAPTNTITWAPTSNSFRFNIYSTSVFMDTYGVVMVNPSLEITNYFPNLDNFYRLYLHNFTIYGDSITVNGQTGTVSNNILTMGGESFIMKDVSITYADGHAYLDDSHATIDLGEITSNDIILNGVWYFETTLEKGYTALKQIYTWDWETFILDNTQFCVFYIGLALIGLVVARRFCIMTVIDYAVLITSIIIALSTQVIA